MAEEQNRKVAEPQLQTMHRRRVEMIRDEAIQMAGAATKIAQAMTQVLERGGAVSIQSQMAFITSAYARMTKDWGVVEHLQALGLQVKKPPPTT